MVKRLMLGTLLAVCAACPGPTPGAPAPTPKPVLVVRAAHPPAELGGAQQFVFEGSYPARVHRTGPEHFKLVRASDGRAVDLVVAYDRDTLDDGQQGCPRAPVVRVTPPTRERLPYNGSFTGVRLFLETGRFDAKDEPGVAGLLDLYGRARLEPGVRYRLTWACWPVGAGEAEEASCEFEAGRPAPR